MDATIKGIIIEVINENTLAVEINRIIHGNIDKNCKMKDKIKLKNSLNNLCVTELERFALYHKLQGRAFSGAIEGRDEAGYLIISKLEILQ